MLIATFATAMAVNLFLVAPAPTLTIELNTPVALERALRFTIREAGRAVGAGVVTDLLTCSR